MLQAGRSSRISPHKLSEPQQARERLAPLRMCFVWRIQHKKTALLQHTAHSSAS